MYIVNRVIKNGPRIVYGGCHILQLISLNSCGSESVSLIMPFDERTEDFSPFQCIVSDFYMCGKWEQCRHFYIHQSLPNRQLNMYSLYVSTLCEMHFIGAQRLILSNFERSYRNAPVHCLIKYKSGLTSTTISANRVRKVPLDMQLAFTIQSIFNTESPLLTLFGPLKEYFSLFSPCIGNKMEALIINKNFKCEFRVRHAT